MRATTLLVLTAVLLFSQSATRRPLGPDPKPQATDPFSVLCKASLEKTVSIDSEWSMVSTQSCGRLAFATGGILRLAPGAILTLTSPPDAPEHQQVFDTSASGSAVRFTHSPSRVSPVWWAGMGAADYAPACNAAALALKDAAHTASGGAHGSSLVWPTGTFPLASTCTLEGFDGLGFAGSGFQTVLRWTGARGGYVVRIAGVTDAYIHDFFGECDRRHPCSAFLNVATGVRGDTTSTASKIERVWLDGGAAGGGDDAVIYSGDDLNNDFHKCMSCRLTNWNHAGFNLATASAVGGQRYSYVFEDCFIEGDNNTYGVYESNSGGPGPSFEWLRGGIVSQLFDFYINAFAGSFPILIEGANSETKGQLLYSNGVTNNITIRGIRYVREGLSTETDFITSLAGNIRIENSEFMTFRKNARDALTIKYVRSASNLPPSFRIENSTIHTKFRTLETLFTGSKPTGEFVDWLSYSNFGWQIDGIGQGLYGSGTSQFSPVSGTFVHNLVPMKFNQLASAIGCAAATTGFQAAISDSLTSTPGANASGGGSLPMVVVCDGNKWRNLSPLYSEGVTGSIAGVVQPGACDSGVAAVAGATPNNSKIMSVTPVSAQDPGDGWWYKAYASGPNSVTVKVCNGTGRAGAPAPSTYRVVVAP